MNKVKRFVRKYRFIIVSLLVLFLVSVGILLTSGNAPAEASVSWGVVPEPFSLNLETAFMKYPDQRLYYPYDSSTVLGLESLRAIRGAPKMSFEYSESLCRRSLYSEDTTLRGSLRDARGLTSWKEIPDFFKNHFYATWERCGLVYVVRVFDKNEEETGVIVTRWIDGIEELEKFHVSLNLDACARGSNDLDALFDQCFNTEEVE